MAAAGAHSRARAGRRTAGPGPDLPRLRHQAARRRRDAIWRAIESTPNFWETLKPIEENAVARIHEMMLRHRRPCPGRVARGGRRRALRLNYHVDDSAQNCIDVISEWSSVYKCQAMPRSFAVVCAIALHRTPDRRPRMPGRRDQPQSNMGCPKCKSDRLKGAAIPAVSLVVWPLVHRRRYRCADCGWTGWKHRLRRRGEASMTVTLQQREGPGARAGWFFIAVVACVLFTTVMLVRSCQPAAPSESVRYTQTNRISPRTRNTGRPPKTPSGFTQPILAGKVAAQQRPERR